MRNRKEVDPLMYGVAIKILLNKVEQLEKNAYANLLPDSFKPPKTESPCTNTVCGSMDLCMKEKRCLKKI